MKRKKKISGITLYAKRWQEIIRIFDEFSLQGLKEGQADLPIRREHVS